MTTEVRIVIEDEEKARYEILAKKYTHKKLYIKGLEAAEKEEEQTAIKLTNGNSDKK